MVLLAVSRSVGRRCDICFVNNELVGKFHVDQMFRRHSV
jgi:hypothetical protein